MVCCDLNRHAANQNFSLEFELNGFGSDSEIIQRVQVASNI